MTEGRNIRLGVCARTCSITSGETFLRLMLPSVDDASSRARAAASPRVTAPSFRCQP